jgi:hypothetical protein
MKAASRGSGRDGRAGADGHCPSLGGWCSRSTPTGCVSLLNHENAAGLCDAASRRDSATWPAAGILSRGPSRAGGPNNRKLESDEDLDGKSRASPSADHVGSTAPSARECVGRQDLNIHFCANLSRSPNDGAGQITAGPPPRKETRPKLEGSIASYSVTLAESLASTSLRFATGSFPLKSAR